MNFFGIHVSSLSGFWWLLGGAAAYIGVLGFFWSLCKAAGDADERMGRK